MKKQWIFKNNSPQLVTELCEEYHIGTAAAAVLQNRIEDIGSFFGMSREELISRLYDPFLLDGMDIAVETIEDAVMNGDKITVYGDYDADGITATAVLYTYLESIGADVDWYIPDRVTEGYGMNKAAVDTLMSRGTKLIITVDTGISAAECIEYASDLGINVIVTDHHECPEKLPECCAVINPKRRGGSYPFSEIAGVGVAFKLVCALNGDAEDIIESCIDLVCLGTVADVMPLVDENRIFVMIGLLAVENSENYGIRSLLEVSGEAGKTVSTRTVGFSLAPRINACGRLKKADTALKMLITDDPDEAKSIAAGLNELNAARQKLCLDIYEQAVAIVEQNGLSRERVIVIAGEGWHHGVIGIVASKITEKYYRPCILLCVDGDTAKGSGRSIESFDLYTALSKTSDCLEAFGGHSLAAGMTLKTSEIVRFRNEINRYAAGVTVREDYIPKLTIDACISPSEINEQTVEQLAMFEPYGNGNPEPLLCVKNAVISELTALSGGKHMRLLLESDGTSFEGIGFGIGSYIRYLKKGDTLDVAGTIRINEYNNNRSVQFVIKDIKFSGKE